MALSNEDREFARRHATAYAAGDCEYGEWYVTSFAEGADTLDDLPNHPDDCAYPAFSSAIYA